MTKENILKEGLLEQYVLGELDASQVYYIEQLRQNDSEIASKLDAIECNFEKVGLENAVKPPTFIKAKLLTEIKASETIVERKPNDKKFWLGMAASLAPLFLIGFLWFYNELNSVKEELRIVVNEKEALEEDLKGINKDYIETKKWYAALSNPDTEQYILKGNTLSPDAKIVSFVNHNDKSVIINTEKLPELDEEHDYQMWADVDGEMIDMGVISKHKTLMAMTYIENAESLNITIEPLGGNDHPTVERLISNVYLD